MAKSTIKFRDSVAAFERIRADLAERRYAPIYLLMGEESYFIDVLTDILAEQVLGEAEKTFDRTILYGKDSDPGAIVNLCRQMPMMGNRQVVIVREAQQLRRIETLSLYTAAPSPSTLLVLCHKEKNLDRRTQLYKQVETRGVVFESVRPRDYEIREWLTRFIQQKGFTAGPKAVEMLIEHLGMDLSKISNELDKLLVSLPEGETKLTPERIESHTGFSKDYNNFELCKAVMTRNEQRALTIADTFARNPKEYPLLLTVMALFNEFRQVFQLNYYRWLNRHKGTPMPSDGELCRILRVPGTFALTEIKQAADNYPNRKVFSILGLLREYDAKSKGMMNGGMSDGELLRELLLKIFLA